MTTKPSDSELLSVEKVISKLQDFLYREDVAPLLGDISLSSYHRHHRSGSPDHGRQRLIKDAGVIDYLMDIVYLPFKHKFYELRSIDQEHSFTKLARLCYSTLKDSILQNRTNQIYLSQWIRIIIEHSIQSNTLNDINSGKVLSELINNNRSILEMRINESIIDVYVR